MSDVLMVCKFALSSPEPLKEWPVIKEEVEAVLSRHGYVCLGSHLEDDSGNPISHHIGSDVFGHLSTKS